MSPELRHRVRESLRTDALARVGGANRRRYHFLLRLVALLGIAGLSGFLMATYRRAEREFQLEKRTILTKYEQQAAPLSSEFRERLDRIDGALARALEPYPGDYVASSSSDGGLGALSRVLEGPLVYVRGPQRGFRTRDQRRTRIGDKGPDALIRCLILPPPSQKESALLRHLGKVYQPAAFRGHFISLERAYAALDFLDSDYVHRLARTESARLLPYLEKALDRAELYQAATFLEAKTFVYALDEPEEPDVVADFDGEAAHHIRLFVMDLSSGEVRMRMRRSVDPAWISEESRLSYSRELDSCRLALHIRTELNE